MTQFERRVTKLEQTMGRRAISYVDLLIEVEAETARKLRLLADGTADELRAELASVDEREAHHRAECARYRKDPAALRRMIEDRVAEWDLPPCRAILQSHYAADPDAPDFAVVQGYQKMRDDIFARLPSEFVHFCQGVA